MSQTHDGMTQCLYCGSSDLEQGVKIGQSADVGAIGLEYRAGFIFGGTEPLYADVCKSCGSVSRIYVKNTQRQWITE